MSMSNLFRLRRGDSQSHVVYAVSFTIIAVVALVGLIMVNSQADDFQTQTTTITNTAPTVTSLSFSTASNSSISALTLTEGGGVATYFSGVAADDNGCDDIDNPTSNWSGAIYRTNVSGGEACSQNNANCYPLPNNTNLVLGACASSTTLAFEYSQAIQYYADATTDANADAPLWSNTNWTAKAIVTDDASAVTSGTVTFEVSPQRALDVASTISFGTLVSGDDSGQASELVTNTGNVKIDILSQVDTAMLCDGIGLIPAGNVVASLSDGFAYAAGTPLQAESDITLDASLAPADSATSSTDTVYFILRVPTGVKGTCTNINTFTAASNT